MNFNAAGVDVSPKELQVCVPSDRDEKCNRTFGAYTKDLHEISSWLKKCGIDTVVMGCRLKSCGYRTKVQHAFISDCQCVVI